MNPYFSFSNILLWTEGIWGVFTVIFWSATYILIAIAGFHSRKNRQVSMPYVAGVLNVSWEIAATVYTEGNPGFIIWFIIDLFILFWGFIFLPSATKRLAYCASIFVSTAALIYLFNNFAPAFLFSVYFIDLVMAVEFIIKRRKLSKKFLIAIAITKLLGDLFAGFTFYHMYDFVILFASACFVCNSIYLCQCIKDRMQQQ